MTAEETLMKYRKVSLTCMKVLEVYEGFSTPGLITIDIDREGYTI